VGRGDDAYEWLSIERTDLHASTLTLIQTFSGTSSFAAICAIQDLMDWTDGRALVGTGTAFAPVNVGGKQVPIAQTNNSYIFPGLALGIIASRARRVTDGSARGADRREACFRRVF
jgi:hypothetical protein